MIEKTAARRALVAVLITCSLLSTLILTSTVTGFSAQTGGSGSRGKNDPGRNSQATTSGQSRSRSRQPASRPSPSQPPAANRTTPPPFDRPPITGGETTTGPADSRSSGTATPTTRERDNRQARSTEDPGIDNPPVESRTGKAPPVLRRPSDSRDPADVENSPSRPPSQPGSDDDTLRLDAALVNIPVVVSDRSGRYVPRLGARDFEVFEDGQRQEVAFFADEQVPFNVALLLDVSPSVAASMEDIQDAAIEFVRQLRSQDRVIVASFDRNIRYLTDLTNDRRTLEQAIRSIQTGGGTSVYDAVYETVSLRMRGIEGRKALILFSDGEDTTSRRADHDDAVNVVTESDVLVYGLRYPSSGGSSGGGGGTITLPLPIPIPIPWPRQRRWPQPGRGRGSDFMSDITAAGGGPVFDADTIGDLSRLARQIAEELRHVYVLSYHPTTPLASGGYRSVRVRVKTNGDYAVRHRRGYNARDDMNSPRRDGRTT